MSTNTALSRKVCKKLHFCVIAEISKVGATPKHQKNFSVMFLWYVNMKSYTQGDLKNFVLFFGTP